MQPQHFHAVLQRGRNRVHYVGSRDEEYLREVVLDIEIMVHEHVILFGVEHFEQRCRRIATEIHGHLVHFIQHEDRVLGAGFLHHLNDLARKRADVGSAMAPNFSFITNAAKRHADELATSGFGDGHS